MSSTSFFACVVAAALACFLLAAGPASAQNEANSTEKGANRAKRLMTVFQVVRFPNDPCNGGGTKNGTCYTEEQCDNRGGTSSGSCAQGYGVCCIFTKNSCGSTSSENCTYFDNPSTVSNGECRLDICKTQTDICQLRLDFNTFVITGPSTDTRSTGKVLQGDLSAGGEAATKASQCLSDTFSVTSGAGNAPPAICGTNSGQHMFVEASDACANLVFQFGTALTDDTALATRSWSIKVTQYACGFSNLAPQGCTQYFFGATTATVQTYNYNGGSGRHLANQDQTICVRRERGNCRICWVATADIDFIVSAPDAAAAGFNSPSSCCGYGADGKKLNGFDCVMIPGAAKKATATMMLPNQICGRSKGLKTAADSATVCSTRTPFLIRFLSDNYEWVTEVMTAAKDQGKGFQLSYTMTTACSG